MTDKKAPPAGWPPYDPGSFGTDRQPPGLKDDPWKEFLGSTSAAMQLATLASLPPGKWKVLSLGAASPFLASLGLDAYRAAQQINGDHPLQLQQEQWKNALAQALKSGNR